MICYSLFAIINQTHNLIWNNKDFENFIRSYYERSKIIKPNFLGWNFKKPNYTISQNFHKVYSSLGRKRGSKKSGLCYASFKIVIMRTFLGELHTFQLFHSRGEKQKFKCSKDVRHNYDSLQMIKCNLTPSSNKITDQLCTWKWQRKNKKEFKECK